MKVTRLSSPVRSSGRWKVSRISSGVFPSISRARPRLVRSTSGVMSSESAALVSSHSLRVSSWRMYFSSKSLRSCEGRKGPETWFPLPR